MREISIKELRRRTLSPDATINLLMDHYKSFKYGITIDAELLEFYINQARYTVYNKTRELKVMLGLKGNPSPLMIKNRIKDMPEINIYLPKTSGNSYSLDKSKLTTNILENSAVNEDIKYVIRTMIEMNEALVFIQNQQDYLLDGVELNVGTNRGTRCIYFRPDFEFIMVPQNTGRIAYREKAFQNFPGEYADVFAAPLTYVKRKFDSGQMDPKIALSVGLIDIPALKRLVELEKDMYFAVVHLLEYIPESRYNDSVLAGVEKMEITPELQEKRKQIKTFLNGTIYNKRTNPGNDPLLTKMIRVIGDNPARLDFIERAKYRISRGDYTVQNVMGEVINVTESGKDFRAYKSKEHFEAHLLNSMVASYIQSVAAYLNRYNVINCLDFLSMETANSAIQLNIHDSIHFNIQTSEDKVFQDFMHEVCAYHVEGWLPIFGEQDEPDFGKKIDFEKNIL